jgi:uncharacterized membrane protein YdjX (TVP38/TMEM64 family)
LFRPIKRKIVFLVILSIFILSFLYLSFPLLPRIDLSQLIALRRKILRFSFLSPFVFFFAQILQILFPILPGNLLNFAGGYIFGIGKGSVLSLLGILFGASLAFSLSRYFGRKALFFFLREERWKRFDERVKKFGPLLFFLLFLLPNPIGDAVFYLYGLTSLPFSFFLPAVLIGRTPGIIFSTYLGSRALSFTLTDWLSFGIVLIVIATLFYLFKERILLFLSRLEKRD